MFQLFKEKSLVGIDISDRSIKALKLSRGRKILAYGKIKMKEGIVDQGAIKNKEELAKALIILLENTQPKPLLAKNKTLKVNLNIPDSKTFMRVFKTSSLAKKEDSKEFVFREAFKKIPVEPKDVYWDFIEIKEGKESIVVFVATFKEIIDSYMEVMEMAGLKPIVLDIESVSIGRAVLSIKKKMSGSSMVINIGGNSSIISVFDKNKIPRMSLDSTIAGKKITQAIMEKFKMNYEKAEKIKIKYGLRDDKKNKAFPVIKDVIQDMVEDVKKTIDYYEENYNSRIQRIFLSGGSSLIVDLDKHLSSQIGREVVMSDSLSRIKNREILDKNKASVFFSNVIGIALRGKEDLLSGINFINQFKEEQERKEEEDKTKKEDNNQSGKKEKKTKLKNKKIIIIPFFVLAMLALGFVLYFYLYASLKKDLGKEKTEIIVSEKDDPEIDLEENISDEASSDEEEKDKETENEEVDLSENEDSPEYIKIKETPTGWLNVREGPGLEYSIVEKVYPEGRYVFLKEQNEWYEIEVDDETKGWIFSEYTERE